MIYIKIRFHTQEYNGKNFVFSLLGVWTRMKSNSNGQLFKKSGLWNVLAKEVLEDQVMSEAIGEKWPHTSQNNNMKEEKGTNQHYVEVYS